MSNFKRRITRRGGSVVIDAASDTGELILSSVNGLIKRILITAPDLDDTDTFTITIADEDGYILYTQETVGEDQQLNIDQDANSLALDIPVAGQVTITIVTSGAQSAEATFGVVLVVDRG